MCVCVLSIHGLVVSGVMCVCVSEHVVQGNGSVKNSQGRDQRRGPKISISVHVGKVLMPISPDC